MKKKFKKNTINSNIHMLCLSVPPILSSISKRHQLCTLAVTLKFRTVNICTVAVCKAHICVCMWYRLLHRCVARYSILYKCVCDALLNAFPSENKSLQLSSDKFSHQMDFGREREKFFFAKT